MANAITKFKLTIWAPVRKWMRQSFNKKDDDPFDTPFAIL